MYLIITIDTEEDNWGGYSLTDYTVENIEKIPYLQDLFNEFDVKPTYLITYPVATDKRAVSILKRILDEGKCEIGTHCHPWNTPPFEEENTKRNSMLCNLSVGLQYKKMMLLHYTIKKNFGIEPVSFRAGRWGYSQDIARNLYRLGYRIDTSITPFMDWTDYYGPDFSDVFPQPFRFSLEDIFKESPNGYLIEIPITVGFLQQNFRLSNRILKILEMKTIKKLGLAGVLYRLNLLNRVWLSPEFSDTNEMIKLTQVMMKKNYKLINMTFHSSSLEAGLSQFVKTKDDKKQFFQRLREFLAFTRDAGIESIRLSETTKLL
jgi:hypothetical protein